MSGCGSRHRLLRQATRRRSPAPPSIRYSFNLIVWQVETIVLHIALHFVVPGFIAAFFFRKTWLLAWLLMCATMLVDLDHLLADPVYDAGRCSIGFHPLHRLGFIIAYVALCLFPKTRLVGIGLSIHMALDAIDCQVTGGIWMHQG